MGEEQVFLTQSSQSAPRVRGEKSGWQVWCFRIKHHITTELRLCQGKCKWCGCLGLGETCEKNAKSPPSTQSSEDKTQPKRLRNGLRRVHARHGETESGLSAITIVELTHGIYRARSDADRERRRLFTEELCRDLTVHPVTLEIAELAGKIEGEQAGVSIAFEDLLVGTTALHLGYAVVTLNTCHFRLIPRLSVVHL